MLTMILAIDKDNLIGDTNSKNGLPWSYPEDLKYYKTHTIDKINIMGRKTFDSIRIALPNRTTCVLTTNNNLKIEGVIMLYSKEDVLNLIHSTNEEVMLIGGSEIFNLLYDSVDKILLTKINSSHTGTTYYNDLDLTNFNLIKKSKGENELLTFEQWERK